MKSRLIISFSIIAIYYLFSALTYYRLKQWYADGRSWTPIFWTYVLSEVIVIVGLIITFYRFSNPPVFPSAVQNWVVGFTFSLLIGKILLGIVLGLDALLGLPFDLVNLVQQQPVEYSPTRRKVVKTLGIAIAGIPFVSLVNGITFGKYAYKVHRITLKFPNLPKAFHGFTVVQLSDIHSGSFDNKSAVQKGVDMVNDLNPDLIAFTGDLVNAHTKEVEPFIDIFGQLKAKHGVYSIKGNHDYGLYKQWESREEHIADQQLMDEYHRAMGFQLLKNESVYIEKEGEQILLAGVENWGAPPFPQLGDLDQAIAGKSADFKLLLSHDPSHWDQQVIPHKENFDLTLSGHTHGMQFGVEIPGFLKWSPVKYKYPRWAGLYEDVNQYLYVNRGFGFIGLPGRVGIMPEITHITLEQA